MRVVFWGFVVFLYFLYLFFKSPVINGCFSQVLFVLIGYPCEFALVYSSVHLATVHLKLPCKTN